MWPYWGLFFLAAAPALISSGEPAAEVRSPNSAAWLFVGLVMTLMIGFRLSVGGDWFSYLYALTLVGGRELQDVLSKGDPGYFALNWLSLQLGWGIYGVNLVCGALFSYGLMLFCANQPRPWVALAVGIPYLVIVVAMGYSRQGVALGLAMAGLVALGQGSVFKFMLWIAAAATFHKTALLLVPVAALAGSKNRFLTISMVGVTAIVLYYALLSKDIDALYTNYVVAQYQSEGALIRLLMNAAPAAALLIWRRRFDFKPSEARLWTLFAIMSLALFGVLFATPASTAVDRIALYLLPLQLVVCARLPDIFTREEEVFDAVDATGGLAIARSSGSAQFLTVSIVLYYGLVEFVWLNFAKTSFAWLPYRFYPFEGLL